jgi:hypothetical protein
MLPDHRVVSATATMLLLRGVDEATCAVAGEAAACALVRGGGWPHVAWRGDAASVTVRGAALPLASAPPRSLTVVSNRSSVVGHLRTAADGAERLLTHGAFIHWFERFDVSRDALVDALETTRAVVEEYRTAHNHR